MCGLNNGGMLVSRAGQRAKVNYEEKLNEEQLV
jgi:hypothetical protein